MKWLYLINSLIRRASLSSVKGEVQYDRSIFIEQAAINGVKKPGLCIVEDACIKCRKS